jgi:hypothetical protein
LRFLEVLLHDDRALDQQAAHADGIRGVRIGRLDDGADRLLDPDVGNLVAVVGQDDVHQVLADVVDVPLDGGQHDGALASLVCLLHVGLEVGHRGLHHLGAGQDEGQLHLPGAEQVPDDLHPGQQVVVDDGQGGQLLEGLRPGPPPSPGAHRR